MRTKCALFLLVLSGAACLAPHAALAARAGSYVAFKGGIYSPSATFNLDNVDLETAFDADTKTGFDGEIALGHYFLPTFALELGVGYFKSKGSFAGGLGTAVRPALDFDVIPLLLSAKALVPVGPVDPYGELGIGAYYTNFNVSGNLDTFDATTKFGMHAGAGVNVNVSSSAFIGLEGRYVWADPSFGGQTITLNDTEYDLSGFKLNGFTVTAVLGLGF